MKSNYPFIENERSDFELKFHFIAIKTTAVNQCIHLNYEDNIAISSIAYLRRQRRILESKSSWNHERQVLYHRISSVFTRKTCLMPRKWNRQLVQDLMNMVIDSTSKLSSSNLSRLLWVKCCWPLFYKIMYLSLLNDFGCLIAGSLIISFKLLVYTSDAFDLLFLMKR